MKPFKVGDKVKDTRHKKSPIIEIIGIYPENYVRCKWVLNGIEFEADFLTSDLTIYKSLECSEVLQLIDESPDANYCKSLNTVLAKYPNIDRKELEMELDKFI
jgi:hypothetical protein